MRSQIVLELILDDLNTICSISDVNQQQIGGQGTIFQYWDKNPPNEIIDNIEGWRHFAEQNDFIYQLFDDTKARDILSEFDPRWLEYYENAIHPAMKADIFRIIFSYINGGAWIDADLQPPLDLEETDLREIFLNNKAKFCFFARRNNGSLRRISNMFFVAPKAHRFLAKLMQAVDLALQTTTDIKIRNETGPGIWTRVFLKKLALPALANDKFCIDFTMVKKLPWKKQSDKKYEYKRESHWSRMKKNKTIVT